MTESKHKVRAYSQWLGPKTRKRIFGHEDAGVPRPGGNVKAEPKGYFRGARCNRAD